MSGRIKVIPMALVLTLLLLLFQPGITVKSNFGRDLEDLENLLDGSYSFDKGGWRVVHLEGDPYQRGFQYGYLLGENISYNLEVTAFGAAGFYAEWKNARKLSLEYWDKVPDEYKQEIFGIADGVKASGVPSPFNRPIDWKDILALNAQVDLAYKQISEESKAKALEKEIAYPSEIEIKLEEGRGCSAFVATGDATKDGGVVIGHETWCSYVGAETNYFIINIKPSKGHEFVMQAMPGLIWSIEDWYINDAGLIITETTLHGRATYNESGKPIFVRIREAVQYSSSIDNFIRRMLKENNGAYPCDWLIADSKTGEIGILELGLENWEVKRTFNGFYGSCNFAWDKQVRKELHRGDYSEDRDYPRWVRWEELSDQYYGDISIGLGKSFLSDHFDQRTRSIHPSGTTLCGHRELDPLENYRPSGAIDGKVTNSSMALGLELIARRGHPCGMDFNATEFLAQHPEYSKYRSYLKDIKAYEWTKLSKE